MPTADLQPLATPAQRAVARRRPAPSRPSDLILMSREIQMNTTTAPSAPTTNASVGADHYASRSLDRPRIVERIDPVVWGGPDGPLDANRLEAFERDGHLTIDAVFSADEIDEMSAALDEQMQPDCLASAGERVVYEPERYDAVRSVFEVHLRSPAFAAALGDERIVGVARQLLGGDVYLHQSRVNRKPAFVGDGFAWHSDFETWHAEDGMPRPRAVSAVIALTDNTPHNGPLMFLSGSHRWFVACPGHTPRANYRTSLREQAIGVPDVASLHGLAEQCPHHSVLAAPGSVTFFDSNLMHGSAANLSAEPRHNVFAVFNHVDNSLGSPPEAPEPRPEFIAARTVRPL